MTSGPPPLQAHSRPRAAGELMLLAITAAWGTTFLATQDVLVSWPPFSLTAARFAMAALVISPFAWRGGMTRSGLRAGAIVGCFCFAGFALQTLSLGRTSAAHAAFGTALVTVFVPLFAALSRRGTWRPSTVVGLLAATAGVGLLVSEKLDPGVQTGDALAVASALAFAVQILLLERFSRRVALLPLVLGELVCTAVLSATVAIVCGEPAVQSGPTAGLIVLYLGLVATAGCMLGQVWGQARTSATRAAFIYALEPIFAAAFGWSLRGQSLTLVECVGGALVVFAAATADRPLPVAWARRARPGLHE